MSAGAARCALLVVAVLGLGCGDSEPSRPPPLPSAPVLPPPLPEPPKATEPEATEDVARRPKATEPAAPTPAAPATTRKKATPKASTPSKASSAKSTTAAPSPSPAPAPPPAAPAPTPTPQAAPAPAPAKPKQRVVVPSTAHLRAEIPSGLQGDLDADPRMQPWLDRVFAVISDCHARAGHAQGTIDGTLVMHANERPDFNMGKLPPQLASVVSCAMGPLMSTKMPLFTGREGTRYPVRLVFQ